MRILVLTYETPSHPGGGGASRQHCLLEPMAARHAIRVVSTGGPPRFGRVPSGVEMRLVDPGPPVDVVGPWLSKNAGHYARGRPWLHHLAEHHRRALASLLADEIRAFGPDAVVVQHGELGSLLELIPGGLARVFELHNMLLTVQAQQLASGGLWERAKAALEMPLMARWERHDLRAATVSIAASDRDRRLAMRLAPSARVEVVPNCIDAAYFDGPAAGRRPARLIFTASFQYPPNQQAARHLLEAVLPAVRRRRGDAELLLAGQQVPAWLHELAATTPGASVAADVDDVRPLLWSSALALAPMRAGSGSPLKILEALASGLPVVASQRAAASLGMDAATGVFAARSTEAMVATIVGLLESPTRASVAATAGRERVLREFDKPVVAPRFEACVREAVAASGSDATVTTRAEATPRLRSRRPRRGP